MMKYTKNNKFTREKMANFGKVTKILTLLGFSIEAKRRNISPLMFAIEQDDYKLAKAICNLRMNLDWSDNNNRNAYHYLAASGKLYTDNIIYDLYQCDVDINHKDKNDNTPLSFAVAYNNFEISEKLLKLGANPLMENVKGVDAFLLACMDRNAEMVEMFKKHGVNINFEHKNGDTYLIKAIKKGCISAVKALMCFGADPNYVNNKHMSAIWMSSHNKEIFNFLINNGGDPNLSHGDGWTPLMLACYSRDIVSVLTLLSCNDINVNQKNDKGDNALTLTLFSGNVHIAKILLEHGAQLSTNISILSIKCPERERCADYILEFFEKMEIDDDRDLIEYYGQ